MVEKKLIWTACRFFTKGNRHDTLLNLLSNESWAGVVTVVGRVHHREVVVVANDATVKAPG